MGHQQNWRRDEDVQDFVLCAVVSVILVLPVGGMIWLMVSMALEPPYRPPDYMVSITGADGLDNQAEAATDGARSFLPTCLLRPHRSGEAAAAATTLSPVLNLTVRIDNSGVGASAKEACVRGLSTAAVSYGDAFLGSGSVPPFCAGVKEAHERAATAWGHDVALPRFLRERLRRELERGEAELDVQVTMPGDCSECGDKVLVCSKVKIGGGFSTCQVYYVRPAAPAAGQFTG